MLIYLILIIITERLIWYSCNNITSTSQPPSLPSQPTPTDVSSTMYDSIRETPTVSCDCHVICHVNLSVLSFP